MRFKAIGMSTSGGGGEKCGLGNPVHLHKWLESTILTLGYMFISLGTIDYTMA